MFLHHRIRNKTRCITYDISSSFVIDAAFVGTVEKEPQWDLMIPEKSSWLTYCCTSGSRLDFKASDKDAQISHSSSSLIERNCLHNCSLNGIFPAQVLERLEYVRIQKFLRELIKAVNPIFFRNHRKQTLYLFQGFLSYLWAAAESRTCKDRRQTSPHQSASHSMKHPVHVPIRHVTVSRIQ